MSTFHERLIVEEIELNERTNKLKQFIDGNKFADVDDLQQELLRIQYNCMNSYLLVLRARIAFMS